MSIIKNLLLVVIVSLITIKLSDITYGYFKSLEVASKGNSITTRSIVLREWGKPGTYFVAPTKQYQAGSSGLELKEYIINIDNDGFISSNKNENIDNNINADIIFFGGSTTEGLFVNENDRFPAVVEKNISKKLKRKIKVLNSGVSGNNAFHSILLLQSKGLKYDPKVVVLMNNVNDYSLLSKTGSYFIAPPNRSIIDDGLDSRKWLSYKILRNIKNLLMPYIYDDILRNYKYLIFNSPDEFEGFRDNSLYSPEEVLHEYENTLRSFIKICKAWNIVPVLMTQAHRIGPDTERHVFSESEKINLDIYWKYHKLFNDKVRQIAYEENIKLIDLEVSIINGKKQYIYDTVHFNSEGSKVVGNLISNELIEYF